MRSLCLRLVVASALLPAAVAQQPDGKAGNAAGDWPFYAGNLAGTKYSSLALINTKNVSQLAPAWSYRLAERGVFEITPIVVNGIMYLPAGNKVVALDAETGKEVWTYQLPDGQASTRGVADWPGDGSNPPRILFTAGRSLLVGLNARTGKLDPGFGKEGEVDMVVGYNGVPTIYKDAAIVGATVGEVPTGPSGNTRAYDARTGAKLWEFHSVAQPGESGHETWLDDGWKGRSGVNV